MPITLIGSNPTFIKEKPNHNDFLNVAELFADTIQGENWTGTPSTFLRLQGCTLECVWCDTLEVWRYGNPYTFDEIFKLFEDNHVIEKFEHGQSLILTGGSPLKQQAKIVNFLQAFELKYGFLPTTEIENEVVLRPSLLMEAYVDRWNNSPKLSNSGMKKIARYKPEIIKYMSELSDSWFKFVITSERDWEEIQEDFLKPGLIQRDQIVLMPEGQTREELQQHYQAVVDLACREGVRMCDRLHVTIWNKKTGV